MTPTERLKGQARTMTGGLPADGFSSSIENVGLPGVGDQQSEPTVADRTTGASLLSGGAWTVVAYVLPQLFTVMLSVSAARYLGPIDMGRQSYMAFVATSIGVCLSLGLPLGVQRFISLSIGAGHPGRARSLGVWAVKWGLLAASIGTVVVASMRFVTYPDLAMAWTLAAAYTGLVILHSFCAQVLYGLQKWRLASLFGLLTGGLTLISAITALSMGYGIVGMFAAEVASAVLSLIGTAFLALRALRELGVPPEPLGDLPGQVLRFAGVTSLGIALDVFLNKRSEFFFLEAFSTAEQIAIYSIGFAVITATIRIPQAVVTIAMPAVATLAGAGQHARIRSGYVYAVRLTVHLTLPLAAASIALGPGMIRLVYGDEYAAAGAVVVAMAPICIVVTPLAAIAAATMTGLGNLRKPLLCGLVGLVANLSLDFALIPRLHAMGAALANDVGQLTAGGLVLAVTSRRLGVRWLQRRLWRSVAASLAAGAVGVIAVHAEVVTGLPVALVLAGLASAASYLVLACLLRVLGAAEAQFLRTALGSRLPLLSRTLARIQERP